MADFGLCEKWNEHALFFAANSCSDKCIRLLLGRGVDANIQNKDSPPKIAFQVIGDCADRWVFDRVPCRLRLIFLKNIKNKEKEKKRMVERKDMDPNFLFSLYISIFYNSIHSYTQCTPILSHVCAKL